MVLNASLNRFSRKLLWAILCFVPLFAKAQQYNFLDYTVRDGLPQSKVLCVFQDNDGYLWIGTEAGASRFDGTEFENFDGSNGLPGNLVTAIAQDKNGILLATDSGIAIFSGGKFQLNRFPAKTNFNHVNAIITNQENDVVLATNSGVVQFSNGNFKKIITSTPIDNLNVRCGYFDSRNDLWIGMASNGLWRLQLHNSVYTAVVFPDQEKLANTQIRGVVENENGILWIATANEGLFTFDGNIITKLVLPERIRTESFTCMHKDMFGDIWLGTWGQGVIHYTRSAFKIYNKQNGLHDDVVTCITSDRQGNSWFGTFSEGLIFFYGNQFASLTEHDGLPDNNVQGLVHDNEGNVWIATLKGVAVYDGLDMKVYDERSGMSNSRAGAIATDGTRIFVGTMNGDISIIDHDKVSVVHSPVDNSMGEIISMTYTHDGTTWIGTVDKGLFTLTNGHVESVNTGNTLLHNPIWSIYESDDGMIWLGTNNGFYQIKDANAIKPVSVGKRKMNSLAVYSIQGDERFIYLTTQRDGIWRYDRTKHIYEVLNAKHDGIGSDFVKGILFRDHKTMYVTHSLGMDRITFSTDSQMIRHFWYSDGIGTDNFTPGVILQTKDGRIWLGSTDGVVIYTSAGERSNLLPPQIELKSVLLFNRETDWTVYSDSILQNGIPFEPVLSSDQNQITFNLAGIQFGAGVNIRYQYILEGLDNNLILLKNGNKVSYSNLSPGRYRFIVKAGNSNNAWSDPITFTFTIEPPFYGTLWFYFSVLGFLTIIGILLVFLYRRFRTDFIRRHRSFGDYQLVTARMVLIFSGVLYPLALFICSVFYKNGDYQFALGLSVAVIQIMFFIGTYTVNYIRKLASLFSQVSYGLLIAHILYINQVNHLIPVTVLIFCVALGAGGVVFDNIRSVTVFSSMLLLSVALLMAVSVRDTSFNKWLILLATVISIVIIYISVLSRLNLFNRLIFADTTINNSKSLVIAADENGKVIFVSRSVRSLLGYNEEEVLGDNWWKVRTDDQEENERMKKQVMDRAGNAPVYVSSLKARNGTIRWMQWSDSVLDNGIKVGIGLDVTDRREIEERYRHIVESAIDLIYTADYKGKFTFINDVVSKITGYKPEDLIGKHFTDVVQDEFQEEVRNFYAKQFKKKTISTYLEFPINTKSGRVIWIGQTVRILFDEKRPSMIRGFQAIARDITEKKGYEEELEKLSLVASETINGVLICDPLGKIEWVNEGFSRITGYSLAEVKDRMPGDVLAGDRTDRSAISLVREQSMMAEGFHKEFLVYHKNGEEIWIAVSNTPIVNEFGKVLKQIEIFNDITEKKRYEIQLDKYSRRLETLNATKEALLNSHSVESIAENVLGHLAERMHYLRRTSIALFDEQAQLIDFVFVLRDGNRKPGKMILPLDSFRSLDLLKANRHYLVNDLGMEKEHSISDLENLDAGVNSYLVTPLYAQGQLLGSVNIGASQAYAISEEDVEMIREVADAMADALLQLRYLGIIEQKNKDISASILYARRIQDAILPPEEMLREQVGDMFVLFKPKDVLSGDFYWAEKLGNYTYLAVVDSTGHGVPGALLSLMGQNLLNQAVHERRLIHPSAILDYLNAGIQHTLNQYKKAGELRDGMDISLCVFENDSRKMQFAGAINPMYIIRDGMLIQSKGNRFSIGSYFDNKMRPFTNQDTELQSGDLIYLFTDGFSDQFGGEEERKFSLKRLRDVLLDIHKEEISVQKKMLEEQLRVWMGDNIQTDDICLIGVRIK